MLNPEVISDSDSHMTDKREHLPLRIGQALMTIGAALAILGLIDIHPITHKFWSHWINGTLFLIGVILAAYGKRRTLGD
jgi:hypothetical protein